MLNNNSESELVEQLKVGERNNKLQSIVRLTRLGRTEETLKAIIPYMAIEDRELSFFAQQAATKIAQRLKIDLDKYIMENQIVQLDDKTELSRDSFLRPKKEKVEELLNIIRAEPHKLDKDILPAVGVFLTRYGGKEDADFIKKQLLNDNSNLVLPYLAAAESKVREILPEVLANLLASSENLVRSRAITVLQRIDAVEAERHFADLLGSTSSENRLAGLGIAMLFPFERVKGYLVTLLTVESNRDVITACQTVLVSNPDLDTVLSILDNLETVSLEQKNILLLVVKNICKALEVAKIMTPEEADYNRIIELWKQQRFHKFLSDLEIHLSSGDEEQKNRIVLWLEANISHESVVEFIRKLENNPQTEDVYRKFAHKLEVPLQEVQEVVEEKIPVEEQEQKPEALQAAKESEKDSKGISLKENEKETIKKLKAVDIASVGQNLSWIIELAQDNRPEMARIRAEALNTMTRESRTGKLVDLAKEAMGAEETMVRVAAFKALERTDMDFLKANLPKLLKEEDRQLRVRVIRFAIKYDPRNAITESRKLLNSSDQSLRTNAVSCLSLCPFKHVAKFLLEHLQKEKHPAIAKQITSIILSNPSRALLDALDNLEANENPEVAMIVAQGRNELAEIVKKMPALAPQEKTEAEKLIGEINLGQKSKEEQKPYSMANVRALAKKNEEKKEKREINIALIVSGVIVLFVVLALPIMIIKTPKKEVVPRVNRPAGQKKQAQGKALVAQRPVPTKFRMNRACSLTGTVEKVLSDTSIIVIHEQTKLNVQYLNGLPIKVKELDRVKMTLVPYKANPQGIIMARGQKLELEK